jgi:hypothetical protein
VRTSFTGPSLRSLVILHGCLVVGRKIRRLLTEVGATVATGTRCGTVLIYGLIGIIQLFLGTETADWRWHKRNTSWVTKAK